MRTSAPTKVRPISAVTHVIPAFVVLAVMLACSYAAYDYVAKSIAERKQTLLEQDAVEIRTRITERADVYINALRGGKALLDASEEVTRDEWNIYTTSFDLQKSYPGIQAFGFAPILQKEEKQAYEETLHAAGYIDHKVLPEGDRDRYVPVTYVEPKTERNLNAIGFDMYNEPTRRKAMDDAAKTGEPTATGKVLLLWEEQEGLRLPGFLIYTPVFARENPDDLIGYVYAPFRMNDLMEGVLGDRNLRLDFAIYDGDRTDEEALMYTSTTTLPAMALSTGQRIEPITIAGRPWKIEFFEKDAAHDAWTDRTLAPFVGFAGGSLSFTVFLLILSISRANERAVRYAKALTADLEQRNIALASSEERLVLATGSAKIGVWEWDIVHDMLTWDDRMYELYGATRGDGTNTYETWYTGLHTDDAMRSAKELQEAIAGTKPFDTAFRVRHPDGKIRYLRAFAKVIRDERGKALRMIGVNWDITKEREVDRMKSEFVSLAAHQLKTPVGAIAWTTEILLDGDLGRLNKRQQESLREIASVNRRMNELVNSLLDLSRIEMGVLIVEPVPSDLKTICNEVLTDLASAAEEKSVRIKKTYGAMSKKIPVDRKLLRVVLQNYMVNAIKYVPRGGRVQVAIKLKSEEIEVAVTNAGSYIEPLEQKRIFEKYYRASSAIAANPNGSGLGLFIAKSVMERCGGRVWFESTKEEGTTFYAAFPAAGMTRTDGTNRLEA